MRRLYLLLGGGGLLAAAAFALLVDSPPAPEPTTTTFDLSEFVDCTEAGYAQVNAAAAAARLPLDHGAHPAVCSELWSVSARLRAEDGRRFGFQLAFFRVALAPEVPAIDSAWATNQVYRAQLTLTDTQTRRFHAYQRVARGGAMKLAGATVSLPRVWVDDWHIAMSPSGSTFDLAAIVESLGVELALTPAKPAVQLTGGSAAVSGYSLSRLQASGELTVAGEQMAVQGTAWLDHGWGSLDFRAGQLVVNRFALQLVDGREIALIEQRRRDGSGKPVVTGVLIDGDGATRRLRRRDIVLESTGSWVGDDGVSYPAGWRLRSAALSLSLEIVPLISDQQLDFPPRVWSGAVNVSGSSSGGGHVELMANAANS